MALTLSRWLAIAVAGALIATAYFLTPRPEVLRASDPRQILDRRVNRTGRAASQAADRLRVLQLRDSVLASFARLPSVDSSRTFFGAGLSPALRRSLAGAADRARAGIRGEARVPFDLVFVLDTSAMVRGVSRGYNAFLTADYQLPESSSDRCLVLARIQPPRAEGLSHSERARATSHELAVTAGRLLGPCAYVTAFGAPGRHVERWLLDRGWSYGAVADWTRAFPRWQPPSWSLAAGFMENGSGWPLRSYISAPGYRCITGDTKECRDLLLFGLPQGRRLRHPEISGDRIVSAGNLAWRWWRGADLGPNQGSLLSEAVRTLGPERFGAFWTSSLPVDEAFREATGQDIGEWTRTWAVAAYGGEQGRGPAIPPTGAIIAMTLVAAALAASMWATRRRQVT